MAEDTGTATAETAKTEKPADQQDQKTEAAKADVDWKAKSREWEQRAKDNKSKADAHDAYVESQKTAEQKLADERDANKTRAESAERELARFRVAAATGIPASLAGRLQGNTEEELTADAESLKELLGVTSSAASFDGGARPSGDKPKDMNDLIRRSIPGNR